MAMPAYLGGVFDMAGMKWYGSNCANKEKGLPRSILMLTLNDKDTGAPVAIHVRKYSFRIPDWCSAGGRI